MDAGIADTINRLDAQRIAEHLDWVDANGCGFQDRPWFMADFASTLLREPGPAHAWIITPLAQRTPGVVFDGAPADCDWDNFFGHVRAAILTRRTDLTASSVHANESVRDGVGSE